MGMKEWAKNEIKIACERERNSSVDPDYGIQCYKSALKAFNSLCKDGHSGLSISITQWILNRLIAGKPLTPIEDIPESWEKQETLPDKKFTYYQCKRMSSLFKKVYKDGSIKYDDVDRTKALYNSEGMGYWHSPLASSVIDEMFPITFPYTGDDKYIVHAEAFLADPKNGDFDTEALLYVDVIGPNGTTKIKLDRYFRESEESEEERYPGWVEISRSTYNRRKKKAEEEEVGNEY